MNKLDHRLSPKTSLHHHANPHFSSPKPMAAPELGDIHGAFGDSDADPFPVVAEADDRTALKTETATPKAQATRASAAMANSPGTMRSRNLHFDAVYWRQALPQRHYVLLDREFERDYEPAYRFGHDQRQLHPHHSRFEDVEHTLQMRWAQFKVQSRLTWQEAKDAVRDAWLRVTDE